LIAAKVLLRDTTVTTREVELWIKHIGPSIESEDSFDEMIAFHEAMHAEGLLANFDAEKLRAFLGKGTAAG
jgi:hypothetical protein